jgi:hypothetical protein
MSFYTQFPGSVRGYQALFEKLTQACFHAYTCTLQSYTTNYINHIVCSIHNSAYLFTLPSLNAFYIISPHYPFPDTLNCILLYIFNYFLPASFPLLDTPNYVSFIVFICYPTAFPLTHIITLKSYPLTATYNHIVSVVNYE